MDHARADRGPSRRLLRRASQRSNVPVRELSAQIVAKTAQGSPKSVRQISPGAQN